MPHKLIDDSADCSASFLDVRGLVELERLWLTRLGQDTGNERRPILGKLARSR